MKCNLKVTLFVACLVVGWTISDSTSPAIASNCVLSSEIQRLQAQMLKIKADPMNSDTVKSQDRLRDTADDILARAFKEKLINDDCAPMILALMAQIAPYDTEALLSQNYARKMNSELHKSGSAVMRAFKGLSAKEKQSLAQSYSLDAR